MFTVPYLRVTNESTYSLIISEKCTRVPEDTEPRLYSLRFCTLAVHTKVLKTQHLKNGKDNYFFSSRPLIFNTLLFPSAPSVNLLQKGSQLP